MTDILRILIEQLGPYIFLLFMLLATFFIGGAVHRRHIRRLQVQEDELRTVLTVEQEHIAHLSVSGGEMLSGVVVVGADYFKHFIGSILNVVGGRMNSYEGILDRARREAMVRLKRACVDKGYNAVVNVRYETTFLTESNQQAIPQVLVMVYGSGVTTDIAATS